MLTQRTDNGRAAQVNVVDITARIDSLDWSAIESSLWQYGYAETPPVLTAEECAALTGLYDDDGRFRKRVIMAQHAFGVGEYKYLRYPLPETVAELRSSLYERLAPIATRWEHALGREVEYPGRLEEFLERCHQVGQDRPTPLLLRYEQGGYNCLHQDLYGEVWFPLQITGFLSKPSVDFDGGEFLLVEQRPRAQSVGHAIQPEQGSLVIFTTRYRPVKGTRGYYRANVRHGVSLIRRGNRSTLGVIFHDAK
jgi:hypothetical protein